MLVIEVTPNDVATQSRSIPAQGGRPERVVYDQTVLFRLGGRSVIESKVSHDSSSDLLQAGLYTLDGSSYQLGNYGNPELKKGYQQKIVKLSEAIAPYIKHLNSSGKSEIKPVTNSLEKV